MATFYHNGISFRNYIAIKNDCKKLLHLNNLPQGLSSNKPCSKIAFSSINCLGSAYGYIKRRRQSGHCGVKPQKVRERHEGPKFAIRGHFLQIF